MVVHDLPARRIALVRWHEAERRWELIFQARELLGAARLVARRAKDHPGCQTVILFCRRDDVGAAVLALRPPPFRQLPLFSEERDGSSSPSSRR